ncbi:MAG: hypothetical protein IPP77_08220 [Bacteroidetes bacterium]|nr:hypothetical protein [Bacteroidota bacterium]
MITPQLISDSIPPVYMTDSVEKVRSVMQEYFVTELPVLDGEKYAGLISIEEINRLQNKKKPLKSFDLTLNKPLVFQNAHIFDIMRVAVEFNVRMVPVVDEDLNYWGIISSQSCLRSFAMLSSVKSQGAVLELETDARNYSVSELSRIVEENDATILCLYSDRNQANGTVEVTIKLNTTDISALIAAFERYEYIVRNIYNETEYTGEIKDRYDALMRYLNV